jgi:hypothetical protein
LQPSSRRQRSSGGGLRRPPPLRGGRRACPRPSGSVGAPADGAPRPRQLLVSTRTSRRSSSVAASVCEQLPASGASSRCRSACTAARTRYRPHAPGGAATIGRRAACLQWHGVHIGAKHVPRSMSHVVSAGRRADGLSSCAACFWTECNVLPCSVAVPDVRNVSQPVHVPYCCTSCYKCSACRCLCMSVTAECGNSFNVFLMLYGLYGKFVWCRGGPLGSCGAVAKSLHCNHIRYT